MKFFQLKSIRTKLIIAAILLLSVPIIVLGYFSYQTSKNSLDASGAKRLETSVELTIEMAERLNEEVEKGNLTLEEAQEMVKVSILGEKDEAGQREINPSLDLGEHGYMFINNSEGTLQAHPNIEGENTWDRTDANGDLYAQDYIKTALDGGGLSYYPYPLPNDENQIEEKVTYSKAFPAWDWVIIGSTYMLDFNSEAKDILNVIYLVIGITLIIGLIIIWFFSDSLATTLQTVTTRMNQIADGDLSEPLLDIKTKDETGQLANALNTMQTGLTNLIRDLSNAISTVTSQSEELNQAAYEVSEGAEQITATMEELASGAESQANDSAEASSMMSSFITIVEQAHEEGESIKNGSNEVLSLTEQGQKLMNTSTEQMNTIDHIVNDAVEKVEGLNTHSQEISAIVSVIQDIAEQTNLLALNAAIEAARAGEHGQGFSVVAEEVRELAEESAESVTDITQIVEQIQSEANIVAHSLKESYEEVEQGTTHMQTTSNTFNEISNAVTTMAENISNVSHNLANIATNSNEMSNAIENIAAVSEEAAAGIEQSTAVTEQSNAAMQEVAGSSEDLAQLAESLSESIEQFRL